MEAGTAVPSPTGAIDMLGEGVSFGSAKESVVSSGSGPISRSCCDVIAASSRARREAKMDRNHLAGLLRRYAIDMDGAGDWS